MIFIFFTLIVIKLKKKNLILSILSLHLSPFLDLPFSISLVDEDASNWRYAEEQFGSWQLRRLGAGDARRNISGALSAVGIGDLGVGVRAGFNNLVFSLNLSISLSLTISRSLSLRVRRRVV